MSKHIEAEGGEILIKSSNGYMAIIPKNMAPWVKEHIKSGNHHIVDGYVKGLQEMKNGSKAQDGGTIKPPTKSIAPVSSTQVKDTITPKLNLGASLPEPKKEVPSFFDVLRKRISGDGRSLIFDVAPNFIPGVETAIDLKDIYGGLLSGNKVQMNSGILGLAAPISGKAVLSGTDYIAEKVLGKKAADEMATRRDDIVNMSERELSAGFNKFGGWGWYDNWVKAGKPKL
jgi:hypothetical protein